ncbi:hypothetical protein NT2_02_03260 [Caenibius tardaugens NBRC 16725]|uniref:Esterase n=1 Tax=Caenibius tardaugens NBRC 16725 TaxID=1219035 RepID=U2ZS99_9SPHN|nr:alpha/beta hydrolase [Caenibius tardaugens]AZI34728.1 alpha/beta hydrolase [Caenibius tardaugens NBRC 16725]GAD48244.1 hypothetical protein NT2_02_03260 [Caenibius tardaugens NBRC 16725]
MTDRVPVSYETLKDPLVLIVPGNTAEDSPQWQQAWARQQANCERLDLGMWHDPHRNTWVNKLNLAISRVNRPVVLVAQGLGNLAVAWWAEYERPAEGGPVVGALLVAPPDLDRPGLDQRVAKFGAVPRRALPFPSFLVPDNYDPNGNYRSAYGLAKDWDARFIDGEDEPGSTTSTREWHFGQRLLNRLLRDYRLSPPVSRSKAPLGAPLSGGLTNNGAPAPVIV